jgi:25S rRNA (uracil2634-N3)-methyltransferase
VQYLCTGIRRQHKLTQNAALEAVVVVVSIMATATISNTKRKKRTRDDDTATIIPFRDCRDLYASNVTLACAIERRCIPCAYKIGCFDVAMDALFCRSIPNQRPEQCPRTNDNIDKLVEAMPGYEKGIRVLTVGDGDFSFSLAVSRWLLSEDADNRFDGSSVVATSYETKETLLSVYPNFEATLEELFKLGAKVHFQVDATNLESTLPLLLDNDNDEEALFDRIVWNFPCSAVQHGQDGQNKEMQINKGLVKAFVGSAISYLSKKNGQIHINHKTKPPFNQWKIEDVAVEASALIQYLGRIVLDRCLFPPYIPRKALDHRSFPVHDACTYVFACRGSFEDITTACKINESNYFPLTNSLSKVDNDLLYSLRKTFLVTDPAASRQKKLKGKRTR